MKVFLLILSLLTVVNVSAGINYKNGNFYLSFTDIDLQNGLKINRAYNSAGFSGGVFGPKWGSNLETKLYNVAGVMLMVEEVPGGGRHHYILKNQKDISNLVNKVIEVAENRRGRLASDKKEALIKTLKGSPLLLGEFARKYKIEGKVKVGSSYFAVDKGGEEIKVLPGGNYVRYGSDGSKDLFNNKGLKIKRQTIGGIKIQYTYNNKNNIVMAKDSRGRWLRAYYSNGNLIKVSAFNGKTARYRYNSKGQLTYVKDSNGNIFKYFYDAKNRMTKAYIPTKQVGLSGWWEMKYDKKGRLVYQKDPGAWQTYLKYASTVTDKEKRQYIEVTKRQGSKLVKQEKYSYVERLNKKGAFYTYKVNYTNNKGYKKEVKYMQCCGKPLFINDNGKVTVYKYDAQKRLVKKVLPDGTVFKAKYDGNRPVEIQNNRVKYFIKYDSKNRVKYIGTKKQNFRLGYDKLNRVTQIKDNKKREIKYIFAQSGRVSGILTQYGLLKIVYDKNNTPVYKPTTKKVKAHMNDIFEIQQDYLDTILILSQMD